MPMTQIKISLDDADLALLDEKCGNLIPRSAYVRDLLHRHLHPTPSPEARLLASRADAFRQSTQRKGKR
jgi:hypothetical protein